MSEAVLIPAGCRLITAGGERMTIIEFQMRVDSQPPGTWGQKYNPLTDCVHPAGYRAGGPGGTFCGSCGQVVD